MIELTQYKCEVCGTLYNDASVCQKCEASHIPVEQVSRYKYYQKGVGPESQYPYEVVVLMTDGQELTFKR